MCFVSNYTNAISTGPIQAGSRATGHSDGHTEWAQPAAARIDPPEGSAMEGKEENMEVGVCVCVCIRLFVCVCV